MVSDDLVSEAMAEFRAVDASDCCHGHEKDIVRQFVASIGAGYADHRLAVDASDTVVCEMAFKFGRADIVIFHVGGSATVVEVKDGTHGYNHVVSGIGQAGLYAAQLAMTRGAVREVRKALLWSSVGNAHLDAVIEAVCLQANVLPLSWPALSKIMAVKVAVANVFAKVA